jgi:hypothetical protein
MRCETCGQTSDYIGGDSDWKSIGDGAAIHALYECLSCGHHQRTR